MATLVLSAAGMALGGSIGGSVMGLSMATIGRAAGAALGQAIDQRLLGAGSDPVETGRVDRFRLTGASEGTPLAQIHGRMRVGGQIIWASRFLESSEVTGGERVSKLGPRSPEVTEYSYSVSLAIALCAGEITGLGRIWADGTEVAPETLNIRLYRGTEAQQPDPRIEAVEGQGNAPAYRGTAYLVMEDLELAPFGNRVPQFTFEVHRAGQPGEPATSDLSHAVRGVALIPGTGEYGLATSPVNMPAGFGENHLVNVNTASGLSDLATSLTALRTEIPTCKSVSLVVSWFGDDLRAGRCRIRPRVEQHETDGEEMPWQVAGITRAEAGLVPQQNGRPVYGGTPCDASVVEAIREMNRKRLHVMFYPFILMEQMAGNELTNPWTGHVGQPALPWRGRITTDWAPGQPGSSDGTAEAAAEVDAFFDGPEGFEAMILHYARLCAQAGGVEAFCIGSEMRGLTQIRGPRGSYPAVARLRALAAKVRAILPETKLSYAADWSEYHGHQFDGDKAFHLDPLWADENIDFIGIDNYMPLSDWRDGDDHLDAHWGAIHNLDYLRANIEGGELYDWYYATPEAREAQRRTPITDGAGEPWVWRPKDLRGWWGSLHHNRVNGQRAANPTPWRPGMKPIRFTEFGCAALDKGTNQPNKFLDPKSSESKLPRYSNGYRDDFIQMQYLRAMIGYYSDPAHNPASPLYEGRMIDMDRAHVWAWDARPWPAFPARDDLWSDGANYDRGHWLNGRATARPLARVVEEICARAGVIDVDTSGLYGLVRGYQAEDTDTPRKALQPLMLAHGFDALERDGRLIFRSRSGAVAADLAEADLALWQQDGLIEESRAAEAEISGRVRVGFVEADGDYRPRAAETVLPGDEAHGATGTEFPLALTSAEAQAMAERWLIEARQSRDQIRFALPPARLNLGAGDVVRLSGRLWRIDRVEQGAERLIEAVGIDPEVYLPHAGVQLGADLPKRRGPAPIEALFLDLPLITGEENPRAPRLAMTGRPWPGIALMQSAAAEGSPYELIEAATRAAPVGITETPLPYAATGLWDYGPALRVKMVQGAPVTRTPEEVVAGANWAAIGDGSPENWELFQFCGAELVADRSWDLTLRLRGQAGSDCKQRVWPVGSKIVLLDGRSREIWLPPSLRGVERHYRWGPQTRPPGDPTWRAHEYAFRGMGLRPYRVAHLRAETGSADHRISWIRRTRLGGDSWEGEVPLAEAREAYRVRIRIDGEIRRDETTTTPHWLYSASDRAADGAGDGYEVIVAQISEEHGSGPGRHLQV